MSRNKIYILIFSIGCFFVSCNYAKTIKKDSQRIFEEKKNVLIELGFKAVIEERKVCIKCDINRYVLMLHITEINKQLEFRNQQYHPYYSFETDSILELSVSKEIYDKVNNYDTLIKRSKSYNFEIKSEEVSFLSDKDYKWFVND